MRRLALVGLLLLLIVAPVAAQVLPGFPTSGIETYYLSGTARGVTADLCGAGNSEGVWFYVIAGKVYVTTTGSGTPGASDVTLNAGDSLYVRPANKLRIVDNGTPASARAQCLQ